MAQEPSILEIEPAWRREIVDMGSKPKFWFRYQDEMWLFKQARPNTGEHWAEKIASEIAALLKLPTHEVRIACAEDRMGCAVRSFLQKDDILVHGNELLAGAIKGNDMAKQRGQADHHFHNIVKTIERLFPAGKVREKESLRSRLLCVRCSGWQYGPPSRELGSGFETGAAATSGGRSQAAI